MSLFVPEFLIRSLQTLTDCKDEIQTVALYINTNKCKFVMILQILAKEFTKSNFKHKILILELANEILLQLSQSDQNAFNLMVGLKNYVPFWYANLLDVNDDFIKNNLKEMKQLWIEKNMFEEKDFTFALKRKRIESNYTKEKMLEIVDKHYDDKKRLKKYFEDYFKNEL